MQVTLDVLYSATCFVTSELIKSPSIQHIRQLTLPHCPLCWSNWQLPQSLSDIVADCLSSESWVSNSVRNGVQYLKTFTQRILEPRRGVAKLLSSRPKKVRLKMNRHYIIILSCLREEEFEVSEKECSRRMVQYTRKYGMAETLYTAAWGYQKGIRKQLLPTKLAR